MLNLLRLLISLVLALAAAGVGAALTVTDDAGRAVTLPGPAQRIVSLAPHITELLFAAGAGEHIVAVGSYSDHPPAAQALPQVGSSSGIDVERLLASRPDLVIAWQSGNGERTIARLRALGLTVFVSEPRRLEDIPRTLVQFGQLAGTKAVAEPAARAFLARQRELAERYSQRPLVRVFYQIWNQPLMTVNGEQMISQVIELCGGRNIFARLPTLAPQVGLEAVLAADPEAIVASGIGIDAPAWLDDWQRWPQLTAVRRGNLFFVPADLVQRQGPRILDGAQLLCEQLEQARSRRCAECAPPR